MKTVILAVALAMGLGCSEYNNDFDLDGIVNATDNCPHDYNPDQQVVSGRVLGWACDWERIVTLSVVPLDITGHRYLLRLEAPIERSEIEALAFSIESYAPSTIESEFYVESVEQTPGLFPHKTATFAAYYMEDCDWWRDCMLIEEWDEERTVDLGVIVFDSPHPPPETSFHGSTNVPDFEWGAVWYDAPVALPTLGGGASTSGQDNDRDGVAEDVDNCPRFYNPSQRDADDDRWGDICDYDAADPLVGADPATGSGVETP